MTSIIPTSVLRAAVLSAFDRGRYSVTFATTPAGDDLAVVPSAIILNLEEQDDDMLGSEPFELFTEAEEQELRRDVVMAMSGVISRDVAEKLAAFDISQVFASDDHGPAVPAQAVSEGLTSYMIQTGPSDRPGFSTMEEVVKVYEFALEDVPHVDGLWLGNVVVTDAPDVQAARAADWVQVYDRVTRERRTLKRPVSDKIVKGLADVAADLRGGHAGDPLEAALAKVVGHHAGRIAAPGQWRVWRDEAGRVRWEKFDT